MIQYEQQTVIKRTMQKGYNAIVNKKRYNQILELLNDQIKDDTLVHIIDNGIKEILNFDPAKTAYNPEYGKNQAEKRKERALKEGKSVYELYRKPYLKKDNKNTGSLTCRIASLIKDDGIKPVDGPNTP